MEFCAAQQSAVIRRTSESAIPPTTYSEEGNRAVVASAVAIPATDWRVVKLLQWIDRRAGAVDCNLDHICQELNLGISSAYAARLFEFHTAQGIRQYTKKKRLLKAIERLITTNLSVKAIAAELGYRKPFDFTRNFEKQLGLTPTRFRNANRLRLMS
jgi:AraC-like DNA-binding protein